MQERHFARVRWGGTAHLAPELVAYNARGSGSSGGCRLIGKADLVAEPLAGVDHGHRAAKRGAHDISSLPATVLSFALATKNMHKAP